MQKFVFAYVARRRLGFYYDPLLLYYYYIRLLVLESYLSHIFELKVFFSKIFELKVFFSKLFLVVYFLLHTSILFILCYFIIQHYAFSLLLFVGAYCAHSLYPLVDTGEEAQRVHTLLCVWMCGCHCATWISSLYIMLLS